MKKKQIYETDDGQTFGNKNEALAHERKLNVDKSLKNFLVKFSTEVKASEFGADQSAEDVLYHIAAAQAGGESNIEPGNQSSTLITLLSEHPNEAAQVFKGTFGSRTPKKKAAKKTAAKKSTAKKEPTKEAPKAPTSEKKDTPPPAPPVEKETPPAPPSGSTPPPPPPPPPAE